MFKATLAGLRARTARMVLSSIAIILGVAFVSGTLILGNALDKNVRDDFARQTQGVDASVTVASSNSAGQNTTRLTQSTVDDIREIPGVAGADGRGGVTVPLLHSDGKASSAFAATVENTQKLREFDVVNGRFPQADNEIAVDTRTAQTAGIAVGQKISVLGQQDNAIPFTVVGTYTQGTNAISLGGDQVLMTPKAVFSLSKQAQFYQIVVAAEPGVSQQDLVRRINSTLGSAYSTQTGADLTAETLKEAARGSGGLTQFMLVFGLISLVVAAMVIYNTFTILLAQRIRELALLRCIGADRKQVFGSVLLEAFVMGLIASVLGLLAGIGLSAGLWKAISAASDGESSLGGVQIVVTPSVVIAAFAVGVLVTVVSAALPALRATRVAPLAALRAVPDGHEEVRRTGAVRIALVALLVIGGGALCWLGMGMDSALLVTGAGTMVLLLAVIVLGPVIVGPSNRLLGLIPRMLFGVPAKLAVANAGRNPKRTAATTAALVIGVTIVTMVTVVATSAKQSANAEIDKRFPADYSITSSVYDHSLPASLPGQLRARPEVWQVAASNATPMTVGQGGDREVWGVDPTAVGTLLNPRVTSGDLHQLGPGTIALSGNAVGGAKLGDRLQVSTADGHQQLKLVAIYSGQELADGLVTLDTFSTIAPARTGYSAILVKTKPGVTPQAGQAAVDKATQNVAVAQVSSAAATKDQLNSRIDSLLTLMWALIGLAVVIALFGIANTLGLSVLERTRETALLRALGLTRGQLRLMLVIESVLMGVLGALLGVVLGGGFAWVLVDALAAGTKDISLSFAIPGGQLAALLGLAVLAAVIASAMPARRAARTSIVAGMAEA
jgi:putative ABC transport system permease protein